MGLFKKEKVRVESTNARAIPFNINCWSYERFSGELLDLDTVISCVDALARNLAKMQLSAIRRDKNNIAITDTTSQIARVLRDPNPYMTQYDFIYKLAAMYFVSNNAYIWPEYDKEGNLLNLWPINYKSAKIHTVNGVDVIRFSFRQGVYFTAPYSQIIHLRNLYIDDDIYGDSNKAFTPIAELANAQNQGIIKGIKNSALIRGLLKATQVMKENDITEARERFIAENFRTQNNGGVMLVDSKFDYTPLKSEPYIVDDKTRKETREASYSYFGVNEAFVQNKFTPDQYDAVYEGKLEPWALMFTQALTKGLYTMRERSFGNEIIPNMARIKFQTTNTTVNVINATKELGLFTKDEFRDMLGYEPLGPERGGDEIMVATNNYESNPTQTTDSTTTTTKESEEKENEEE